MANIFIIHGAYGNPEENWFQWLKSELEKSGHQVYVPKFPTPENQGLAQWLEIIKGYSLEINAETIFIGHSVGAPFILNIISKKNMPIKAAYLVAGFVSDLNIESIKEINSSFLNNFNWTQIKENCKNFIIFNSDNDPYVPIAKAGELAEHLSVAPIIIAGAGHFNEAAGYTKFDLLLQKIKELI